MHLYAHLLRRRSLAVLLMLLPVYAISAPVNILNPFDARPTAFPSSTTDSTPLNLQSWQQHIPDDTPLWNISIPGSHDSLAGPSIQHNPISHTQSHPLSTQLHIGIRFLDLRFRHHNDVLVAHHGQTYLYTDFPTTICTLAEFLTSDAGRTEMVIARLKDEYTEEYNTRTWKDTLDWYATEHPGTSDALAKILYRPPCWDWNSISSDCAFYDWSLPSLTAETRGKLVILEDFPHRNGSYGPPYYSPQIVTQDAWIVNWPSELASKWERVRSFWVNHDKDTNIERLLINYISAAGFPLTPKNVAEWVWPRVFRMLQRRLKEGKEEERRAIGVVAGDFVTRATARVVVAGNFVEGAVAEETDVDTRMDGWGMWTLEEPMKEERSWWESIWRWLFSADDE